MAVEEKLKIGLQDNTSKSLKKIKKNLGGVDKVLGKLKGGFATAAGVGGVAYFVNKVIDSADEVQKMSIRLGASTEALSEYRLVAQKAGVDFRTFTMGLQRMTRRVNEAAIGTGEARGALKELGLDAKVLSKLAPEDQFEAIAAEMEKIDDEGSKVRLAMRLFDSEGVALVQTMKGGAEAIRAVRAEARSLGMSISQEDADRMAQVKDSFTLMKGALSGLGQELVMQLAEPLAAASLAAAEFIKNMTSLPGVVTFSLLGKSADDLKRMKLELTALRAGADAGFKSMQGGDFLREDLNFFDKTMGKLLGGTLFKGLAEYDPEAHAAALANFDEKIQKIRDRLVFIAQLAPSGLPGLLIPEGADEKAAAAEKLKKYMETMGKEAAKVKENLKSPLDKFFDDLDRLQVLLDLTLISETELEDESRRLAAAFEAAHGPASRLTKDLQEQEEAAQKLKVSMKLELVGAISSLGDAFSSFIFGVEEDFLDLERFIRQVFARIASLYIQANVIDPLATALGLAGSAAGGGGGGGGGIEEAAGGLGGYQNLQTAPGIQINVSAIDSRSFADSLNQHDVRRALTSIVHDSFNVRGKRGFKR